MISQWARLHARQRSRVIFTGPLQHGGTCSRETFKREKKCYTTAFHFKVLRKYFFVVPEHIPVNINSQGIKNIIVVFFLSPPPFSFPFFPPFFLIVVSTDALLPCALVYFGGIAVINIIDHLHLFPQATLSFFLFFSISPSSSSSPHLEPADE